MINFHKLNPVETKDRDGRLPPWEQYIVGSLALMQRDVGLHAIEIGTLYGDTATNIARAMPNHLVITVDIPDCATPAFPVAIDNSKYFGREPRFGDDVVHRIERILCDSAKLFLPPEIEIGFAFIDGAHTYEYVWNDFKKIRDRLISDAVVVFHDVGVFEGVEQAVSEIIASTKNWQWSAYGGTSLVWGKVR